MGFGIVRENVKIVAVIWKCFVQYEKEIVNVGDFFLAQLERRFC